MNMWYVLAILLLVASCMSVCEARIGACSLREMCGDPMAIAWILAVVAFVIVALC